MYTVRPLCDHHCIPIFNLCDSFKYEVNVNIRTIQFHILELGTNATETIMQGHDLFWTLAFKTTMIEVGQQCEPNTTLVAVPKAGDFSQLKTNQRLSGSVVPDIY